MPELDGLRQPREEAAVPPVPKHPGAAHARVPGSERDVADLLERVPAGLAGLGLD